MLYVMASRGENIDAIAFNEKPSENDYNTAPPPLPLPHPHFTQQQTQTYTRVTKNGGTADWNKHRLHRVQIRDATR